MKLSVIIVNYKVPEYLHQCLLSLEKACKGMDAEFFVVDNASGDNSVQFLRNLHPQVNYIENQENLGFSKANNIAMRKAVGEYLLIINPDTFVAETMIRECAEFMDAHPEVGATGVKQHYADGRFARESKRAVPKPLTAFFKLIGCCKWFPKHPVLGRYYLGHLDNHQQQEIEILSGACMFIRKSALEKVGFFDEDYFMYGEDIDLSYRILKAGYKNYYLPVKIIHYKGESTQKISYSYVNNFNKSMIIFFRKHFSVYSWMLELPILAAVYLKAFCGFINVSIHKLFKSNQVQPDIMSGKKFLVITDNPQADKAVDKLRSKGLKTDILIIDDKVRKFGHTTTEHQGKDYDFVVYNVNSFDYAQIIGFFENEHDKFAKPEMAIYHQDIDKIITTYAVI